MIAKDAKGAASQWVSNIGSQTPGFYGAYYAGSILDRSDGMTLPATSDVDVTIVINGLAPTLKLGKLIYQDALLDVSYTAKDQLEPPERVLGNHHLAHSFSIPNVISDPSGELTRLQAAVSAAYAKKHWVETRCRHARNKVLTNLQQVRAPLPFHEQVMAWLFGAGVTTHILLAAGTENPTVRRRYLAVKELLAAYGRADFYEQLLALLGCERMSTAQASDHLNSVAAAFDAAKIGVKSPFFFATDISDLARPLAIDGSKELIEKGYPREAVFWIAATYGRCMTIFAHDAPALYPAFYPGFERLLHDLSLSNASDLVQRSKQIEGFLPAIWKAAQAIMAANPEIEEE